MSVPWVDAIALEAASDSDRKWFEAHPGENTRVRPVIAGEFPTTSGDPGPEHVLVTQIRPGFRTRQAIAIYKRVELRPFEDIPATVDGLQKLTRHDQLPEVVLAPKELQ